MSKKDTRPKGDPLSSEMSWLRQGFWKTDKYLTKEKDRKSPCVGGSYLLIPGHYTQNSGNMFTVWIKVFHAEKIVQKVLRHKM